MNFLIFADLLLDDIHIEIIIVEIIIVVVIEDYFDVSNIADFQWITSLIIYDESFRIALSDGLLKRWGLLRGY